MKSSKYFEVGNHFRRLLLKSRVDGSENCCRRLRYILDVPAGLLGQTLKEGRGHHNDSGIHVQKRLRLALGGITYNGIGGNRPALPPPVALKDDIGRGSLVFKVSDRGWLVTSSSPVPLKTRRVGKRCT
ncbi:hypothetical protein TNCV_662401 [Trichonephila clavipes]|nr:hypothetical protein TNCV_662401 [Trichonephila clavipes]